MSVPTWGSVVAAVPHDEGPKLRTVYPSTPKQEAAEEAKNDRLTRVTPPRCSALGVFTFRNGNPIYPEYRCDCTRDARIGAGIAAALTCEGIFDQPGQVVTTLDEARVAAFIAASKKEEKSNA